MKITKIEIENYKNIQSFNIDINKDIVLVQTNFVHTSNRFALGKTNFLNAIRWCISKPQSSPRFDRTENEELYQKLLNKEINSFDVRIMIEFLDENNTPHKAERIVHFSYEKTENSFKFDEGYYVQEEFYFDKKTHLPIYLEKCKDTELPLMFDDTLNLYANSSNLELLVKTINNMQNNQLFIISYDNLSNEPTIANTLTNLNKDFQTIFIA